MALKIDNCDRFCTKTVFIALIPQHNQVCLSVMPQRSSQITLFKYFDQYKVDKWLKCSTCEFQELISK